MASDRLTGKASFLTYNNVQIAITKYEQDAEKNNADVTDSGDYDQQTDLIYPTQIPISVSTKLSIEGRFRRSSVPATIIAAFYSGLTDVPVTLGLDAGTMAGHGAFNFSNFKLSVPIDDAVTYTASLTSSGKFIANS